MLWIVAVLLTLVLVVAAAFAISPVPSVLLFRNAFKDHETVKPEGFAAMKRQVSVTRDLSYPSSYRRSNFDIYRPTNVAADKALPVIVWVHGGGFLAGDKSGLSTYGVMLASQGYEVVAMNYDYAPTGKYPTPVIQVGQLVSHLYDVAQRYHLDTDRIIIGGDSAGAQIAAQFAAVQTTEGYAKTSGIKRIDMKRPLTGAILFCGPYDFTKFTSSDSSWMLRWFKNTVAWGYLGDRNWRDSPELRLASVTAHVSANFPKSYVVDGNAFSFPEQGKELVAALKADGVDVTSSFFPNNPKLPHEFQFDFSHPESSEVWLKTKAFLNGMQ